MVGKDEELADIDDESLARVRLIAEKKRQLELTAEQVQQSIKSSFEQVYETLRTREKQLLRQVEAIQRQQISLIQSNSELLSSNLQASFEDEQEVVQRLRNFGNIHLSNSIAVNDAEPYKVEEYQEASEDIVNFDKSLKSESQEFDVSSVIRRKRDSSGLHSKNISINLNCTNCEGRKFETPAASTPSTSKQPAESPLSPSSSAGSCSGRFENLYFKEALSAKVSSSSGGSGSSDKSPPKEMDDEKVAAAIDEIDASSSSSSSCSKTAIKMQEGEQSEHSVQIQQWLKQILAEPETEPIIHEIGQFTKIPNTRLYREFPVET